MAPSPDYADMFSALNAHDARYLIVGGYAVIFHTEPRYTKDVDIWVEPSAQNAARVYRALADFGAPLEGLSAADLSTPGVVFQLGVEPVRIDVLTSIGSFDFGECAARAVKTTFAGHRVRILSLDDLILSKTAANRPQDRIDVENLEAARTESES